MTRPGDEGWLRAQALGVFRAGVEAVDPYRVVRQALLLEQGGLRVTGPEGTSFVPLEPGARVLVLGAGKATAGMALAVEEVLGDRLTAGVVTVKWGHRRDLRRVQQLEAGHPVPDQAGEAAARAQLALLAGLGPRDLVLALFSGGGSALLAAPAADLALADLQVLTELLLGSGATIQEMNAVRRHVSALQGGQLARRAAPARLVTLLLSDVVGDAQDAIASGPTVPDPSTFAEARAVLARLHLEDQVPASVRARLEAGAAGRLDETPKPGDPLFEGHRVHVLASNRQALDACAHEARARGLAAAVLASTVQGEAREVARVVAALGREARGGGGALAPPCCLLLGGETTVTRRGPGKGGRNQELALAAALDLAGLAGVAVAALGSDGGDGPTDAAGAVVTGSTLARGHALGLDARAALAANDAYPYLDAVGDLVRTGPTGTNVMDLILVLAA